ncbi:MAG: hypothetical protein BJ554DRAFT_8045, partial [Olpidium bornovanus]
RGGHRSHQGGRRVQKQDVPVSGLGRVADYTGSARHARTFQGRVHHFPENSPACSASSHPSDSSQADPQAVGRADRRPLSRPAPDDGSRNVHQRICPRGLGPDDAEFRGLDIERRGHLRIGRGGGTSPPGLAPLRGQKRTSASAISAVSDFCMFVRLVLHPPFPPPSPPLRRAG